MLYDENKVYRIFQTDGHTFTKKNIYNDTSLEGCFNKIDELELPYSYFSGDTISIQFSGGTRTVM